MTSSSPALELHELGRRFGDRAALSGLTLKLRRGATLAILGPNGAGKTTLLRLLAGLLRPHSGAVTVLGANLPDESHLLRGRIGWLGHEPLLYKELSAHQNLQFHARLHGLPSSRVAEVLAAVGMSARGEEPLRDLSRGMIQRLAAARAVISAPELLLLDEPYANLDPTAQMLIEPLIGRGTGITRVISSHDPAAALSEADLVLGLRGGRISILSEPDHIAEQQLQELYL